jgi:flavin-binding protein dodecin
MAVLKAIEIMASSPKSWENATIIAVKSAGEILKGIHSIYIHRLNM